MELTDEAAGVVGASLSKAEKIRRLKRLGMRQADIARALGIRDAFVSSVVGRVRRAEASASEPTSATTTPMAPTAMPRQVRTQVGEGGRVVIPAGFRAVLGIDVGDHVFLRLEDHEVRLFTPREAIRRAQELISQFVPDDVSLADELIAERRAEAARE